MNQYDLTLNVILVTIVFAGILEFLKKISIANLASLEQVTTDDGKWSLGTRKLYTQLCGYLSQAREFLEELPRPVPLTADNSAFAAAYSSRTEKNRAKQWLISASVIAGQLEIGKRIGEIPRQMNDDILISNSVMTFTPFIERIVELEATLTEDIKKMETLLNYSKWKRLRLTILVCSILEIAIVVGFAIYLMQHPS